ncbi:MAG TPA: flagellar basal-body MS-ring/collar protein FliF [Chloroflexota bacterium]|nr:flagellar basal-body MS-ring/collar protein FliF [Chloroflexota bacterium]
MGNALTAIREQFARIWGNMGSVQKISVGVILLVAVASLGVFVLMSSRPNYVTVFNNLTDQDAAAIVTKLKAGKIPYQTADGGKTIKVPRDKADDVRLSVAASGLPQSGVVGYEVFDKTNFSTTDFNNKVNLQRALEGELDRTIARLDGVQSATVHLVIPEQALFQQQQQPTTASVALQLKPGVSLTPDQTRAVTKLVSSSVQGLKSENVTVVDQNGNILTDQISPQNSPQQALKATQEQLKLQRDYEQTLQRDLQNTLDRVLGPSQSVVKVTAAMNFDQSQTTSELFAPDNKSVVRSQRQVTENFQGSGTPPIGGVPGTESNVPTYQGAIAAGGPSQYSKTDNTQNYEISKAIQQVAKAPGSIERLTVAALVNPAAVSTTSDPQSTVNGLKSTLEAAAGANPARGDNVIVTMMDFNAKPDRSAADALAAKQRQELIQRIVEGAGVALVALVLLFFFRSLVLSLRPAEVDLLPVPLTVGELAGEGLPELTDEELMMARAAALGTDLAPADEASGEAAESEAEPEPELLAEEPQVDTEADRRRRVIEERMKAIARQKPEIVARLLQTWIGERRY